MKNFIWDFDGTIFNSYPHITKAFSFVLDKRNEKYDIKEIRAALEVTFLNAFEKYSFTKEEIAEFHKNTDIVDLEPIIEPYVDTYEVLKYIVSQGGTNFIYTHRNRESLEYYLKKYGMDKFFKYYVTNSDECFASKPAPDSVEHIVEKFGLSKQDTIIIGDREIDVLSGLNAGISGGLVILDKPETDTAANYVFGDLLSIKKLI